jgi:hypothetical protein
MIGWQQAVQRRGHLVLEVGLDGLGPIEHLQGHDALEVGRNRLGRVELAQHVWDHEALQRLVEGVADEGADARERGKRELQVVGTHFREGEAGEEHDACELFREEHAVGDGDAASHGVADDDGLVEVEAADGVVDDASLGFGPCTVGGAVAVSVAGAIDLARRWECQAAPPRSPTAADEEEQELFPAARKVLDRSEREALGEQLEARKQELMAEMS